MNDDAKRLTATMLHQTREDLSKADTKASILFAVAGVVTGGLLAAALSGDWTPADLPLAAEIVAWFAVAALLTALVLLGWAIFPRIRVRSPGRLTYFGQVQKYESLEALCEGLSREAAHPQYRDAEQLLSLSRIAWTKYRLIQAALWVQATALVLSVTTGLVFVATS